MIILLFLLNAPDLFIVTNITFYLFFLSLLLLQCHRKNQRLSMNMVILSTKSPALTKRAVTWLCSALSPGVSPTFCNKRQVE